MGPGDANFGEELEGSYPSCRGPLQFFRDWYPVMVLPLLYKEVALREDLGVILGERRSPSVQSLRKKVCALSGECGPCDAVPRAVSQLCEIGAGLGRAVFT